MSQESFLSILCISASCFSSSVTLPLSFSTAALDEVSRSFTSWSFLSAWKKRKYCLRLRSTIPFSSTKNWEGSPTKVKPNRASQESCIKWNKCSWSLPIVRVFVVDGMNRNFSACLSSTEVLTTWPAGEFVWVYFALSTQITKDWQAPEEWGRSRTPSWDCFVEGRGDSEKFNRTNIPFSLLRLYHSTALCSILAIFRAWSAIVWKTEPVPGGAMLLPDAIRKAGLNPITVSFASTIARFAAAISGSVIPPESRSVEPRVHLHCTTLRLRNRDIKGREGCPDFPFKADSWPTGYFRA